MNREETHALFRQGRDAWNAWAQGMLDKKAEMVADGREEEWKQEAEAFRVGLAQ